MKKFLLNVSKRNIPRLFIVFLVMLLMILFSSAKTVYAASGSSNYLYNGTDFIVERVYKKEENVYLDIVSKLPRDGNYATHLNFETCSGTLNGSSNTYSLTLTNSSTGEYYYAGKEIYCVNNLNITGSMYFKFTNIGGYDVSSARVYFSTTSSNIKKLKTAQAYGYIFTAEWKRLFWHDHYESLIFFSLYVDGVGYISPSELNSLKFSFVTKKGHTIDEPDYLTYIDSDFKSKGTKDVNIRWRVAPEVRMLMANVEDAYYYDLSEPSRKSGLSNNFKAEMYGSDSGLNSVWLNKANEENLFEDFPEDFLENCNYLIHLNHCPNLNGGNLRNGDKTNSFGIVEFTYWGDDCELIGASLYDTQVIDGVERPVFVAKDENGNVFVYTIDDNGNIVNADGYYVDKYGNLYDPNGKFVGFGDRNNFIGTKDPDIGLDDEIFKWVKRIFTAVLFVFGIIIVLKIIKLLKGVFGSKSKDVNINVRTGSNKSSRRRKR